MTVKAYLSNLSPTWPMERQEALLAGYVPGWPDAVALYRDVLTPGARKAHSAKMLKHRAKLLRPTERPALGEVIYVASPAVLDWGSDGFLACLKAIAARRAALVFLDTGRRLEHDASGVDVTAAMQEFRTARLKRKVIGGGPAVGNRVSARKRIASADARAELIRADWSRAEVPTAELLLRAGKVPKGRKEVVPMSYGTAVERLGARPQKIRNMEAARKRAERGKAK